MREMHAGKYTACAPAAVVLGTAPAAWGMSGVHSIMLSPMMPFIMREMARTLPAPITD